MQVTSSVDIIRYRDGQFTETTDLMVNEVCLQLQINGAAPQRLYCTPAEWPELVIGHLYCSGRITALSDITALELNEAAATASVTLSSPAACPLAVAPRPAPELRFTAEGIVQNQARFYADSALQKATAGVHRCALCDNGGTLLACEDISRHNAFDKAVGQALKKGIDLCDKYLLTSGRIPLDMMRKAVICGLPMVVSRSTPTVAAVEEARRNDITLLGFSRENRFNIYSGAQRIV